MYQSVQSRMCFIPNIVFYFLPRIMYFHCDTYSSSDIANHVCKKVQILFKFSCLFVFLNQNYMPSSWQQQQRISIAATYDKVISLNAYVCIYMKYVHRISFSAINECSYYQVHSSMPLQVFNFNFRYLRLSFNISVYPTYRKDISSQPQI